MSASNSWRAASHDSGRSQDSFWGGGGWAIHHLSSVLFQTEWERAPLTISRAKLLFTSGEPCPLRRPSHRVVQSSGVRVLSWGQIKSWRADMAATPGSSPLYVSTREKRWFCWFSLHKRQKNPRKAPHPSRLSRHKGIYFLLFCSFQFCFAWIHILFHRVNHNRWILNKMPLNLNDCELLCLL